MQIKKNAYKQDPKMLLSSLAHLRWTEMKWNIVPLSDSQHSWWNGGAWHGMGNLHICESLIDAEQYIQYYSDGIFFQGSPCLAQQENAKLHSANFTTPCLHSKSVGNWPFNHKKKSGALLSEKYNKVDLDYWAVEILYQARMEEKKLFVWLSCKQTCFYSYIVFLAE